MEFKSGEFPGHSRTFIWFSWKAAKNTSTIWKCCLHPSHNLAQDYVDELVSTHHS